MTSWHDPLPHPLTSTFWGQLRQSDRQILTSVGTVAHFARGETLCHENQRCGRVFLIHHGVVEVFRDNAAGHRTVLARRGAGDIIGELAAVDGEAASASVSAIEPTAALAVAADHFAQVCQEHPRIAWQVLRIAVARLRDSDVHRSRARADVRHRTVVKLLELADSAPGGTGAPSVTVRLSQQALADMVSASLVSVTRALEHLRLIGAIDTQRGRLTIHVDRLRRITDLSV